MKHNSDKMTIAPMSSQPCSKPNVGGWHICKSTIHFTHMSLKII
jgi:hypothetical protein